MIEQLPLWILLTLYGMRRKPRAGIQNVDYAKLRAFYSDLYRSLPIPGNRLERWLIHKVCNWIDAQQDALLKMRQMMVVATGIVYADEPPQHRILV